MEEYTKPLPRGEDLHQEFYQFCTKHELRFQRCGACDTWSPDDGMAAIR